MDGLFDDEMIEEVISDQERERLRKKDVEHQIEMDAQRIFRPWVDRWYKGHYTQDKGHIVKVIKDSLRDGIHPDLVGLAMNYLGNEAQAVTKLSLQFAISQAEKYRKLQGFEQGSLLPAGDDQTGYTEDLHRPDQNSAHDNDDDYVESI